MIPLPPQDAIVVTATRVPETKDATAASLTLIDADRIARLGAPLVSELLRLVPSVAVSTSGPAGSLTDVRIRGAEANHTLLFVDGIRANDPAAGNAPRFELLGADLASRIEVVRGPQSALWGSEAIGGVIAVDGATPGSGGSIVDVEAGSHSSLRGAARTSLGDAERGVSLGIAGQRSGGIDSFARDGERDGYRNLTGRVLGSYRLGERVRLAASGFAVRGMSEFDGFDPSTFLRGETLDRTINRLAAGRVGATYGERGGSFVSAAASLLGSRNINRVGDDAVNATRARRTTVTIEAGHRVGRHALVAAVEREDEHLAARDAAYGGLSDQERSRRHQSLTLEYKMEDLGPLSTDIAVRHDSFSRFRDATTVRAAALVKLGGGLSLSATYGQGIAQPTFFDLYGLFPGSFAGNPSLRPEKSRGGEIALRYRHAALSAALTVFRQRLRDEIVDVFAFPLSTTINAEGVSRRQGIEAEADYRPSAALHVSATYAFLDASEPGGLGGAQLKEQRRPQHSGSIAVDGTQGRISYGAALAYTGAHLDSDFDQFPAVRVKLGAYWLGSARIGYRVSRAAELHLRVANALGAKYQDVLGYRTEGRSIHAGVRLGLGR